MAYATAAAAIATVALTAVSTANSISEAKAKRKLSRASNRLDQARLARDKQLELSKSLAGQAVAAGARGVVPSSGSLMQQAMAARSSVARQIRNGQAIGALNEARSQIDTSSAISNSLIGFGKTVASNAPTIRTGILQALEENAASAPAKPKPVD